MARKRKQPAIETEPTRVQEQSPVVTPEIEDGYEGVVKRLYCSICQHGFYVTEANYLALSPHTCHDCGAKVFRAYEEKRLRELAAQERSKFEEERRRKVDEILGFTYVRPHAEEKLFKKEWNYGYTMLYCVELPFEKGRLWRVRIYKDDKASGLSNHAVFGFWEMDKQCHIYFPIARYTYPAIDPMEFLSENDPDLPELKFLAETDPALFERKFLEKIYNRKG